MNNNFKSISLSLKSASEKTGQIKFAYLYGSFAIDKKTPFSDIDIAVYLDKSCKYIDLELEIHSIISRELKTNNLDLLIINNCRNIMLMEEIIKHGLVVLDKDIIEREKFEITAFHTAIDFKYQRKIFLGR